MNNVRIGIATCSRRDPTMQTWVEGEAWASFIVGERLMVRLLALLLLLLLLGSLSNCDTSVPSPNTAARAAIPTESEPCNAGGETYQLEKVGCPRSSFSERS